MVYGVHLQGRYSVLEMSWATLKRKEFWLRTGPEVIKKFHA